MVNPVQKLQSSSQTPPHAGWFSWLGLGTSNQQEQSQEATSQTTEQNQQISAEAVNQNHDQQLEQASPDNKTAMGIEEKKIADLTFEKSQENIEMTTLFQLTIENLKERIVPYKNWVISKAQNLSIEITKTKIIQAIALLTSGYSLLGIKATFGSLLPQTFGAFIGSVPFLALSGGLLWYAGTLIDYDSESSHESIRKDFSHMEFGEAIKKYDLVQVFLHKIITNEEFNTAYRAYVETIDVNSAIILHSKTRLALAKAKTSIAPCKYDVPPLSELKDKFRQEIQKFPRGVKLSELYDLPYFVESQIITQETKDELLKSEKSYEETTAKEENIRTENKKKIDELLNQITSQMRDLKRLQAKAITGALSEADQALLAKHIVTEEDKKELKNQEQPEKQASQEP